MYYCICHTCDENGTFPDRERAQVVFNEHAQHRHEVVLRRARSPVDTVVPEPQREADTSDAAKPPPGADDSGPVDG